MNTDFEYCTVKSKKKCPLREKCLRAVTPPFSTPYWTIEGRYNKEAKQCSMFVPKEDCIMNHQSYGQKKHNCWQEYCRMHPLCNTDAMKPHFDWVFGRAYTLGKQEKGSEDGSLWIRLTDDEKREMQCRYHTNECVLRDHRKRTGDKAQSKAVARMKLLENLFGKENLNPQQ